MFRRPQKNLVYFLIFLIPFFIFFVRSQLFESLKFSVIRLTSGPIRILQFPLKEMKKILFYHRTFDEYIRLRKEVDVLKGRITTMDEVLLENSRLEQLLEFKRKLIYSSVAASVIGRDPNFWNSSMIIDKGSDDGIKAGLPVVNAFGVVGIIAEVDSNKSKVVLITDPQFSVAAMVQRPRESALITGSLAGTCRLKFVKEDADIRAGDQVITSKLSGSFPEGLLLGQIIEVKRSDSEGVASTIVEPAVPLSQLEEVLIILGE